MSQPPIPGAVLLFTSEQLDFEPVGRFQNVGNLQEPRGKFLIIDGQHRLAALHFYRSERAEEAASIHVPCVIFDGKSSVTIKAMIRVCADLAAADADPAEGRVRRWERRLSPWAEIVRSFRADGFYERFPSKGQVERVARIHKELARAAEIEPAVRGGRRKAVSER